jgi:protein-S-isoprenylcysteine O-methyltransferase Ste14
MITLFVFTLLAIPLIIISFRSLKKPGSHGFYRFFGWEATLFLAVCNIRFWFTDPSSIPQIISWICLFYALYLVIAGVILLKKRGKAQKSREDTALFAFEKTTQLVETGLFRYIRHPLYGSLLFLSVGIFLKHPACFQLVVTLFSSVMYYLTARMDEKECVAYFGDVYRAYMKRTKMFIPWIF